MITSVYACVGGNAALSLLPNYDLNGFLAAGAGVDPDVIGIFMCWGTDDVYQLDLSYPVAKGQPIFLHSEGPATAIITIEPAVPPAENG